jgi:transglutaminase-like putative cysteine protease
MSHRLLGFFILILLSASTAFAGDEAPAWLQQAAAQKSPAYEKTVPAVVLLNESSVTVGEDGRIITTSTYAVRILKREGRGEAVAREFYVTDTGKVRELKAWLIRADGDVKRYGKEQTLDIASANNDVYDESRFKVIDASNEADAGMVFGYQSITESRSFFSQSLWYFQENLPVAQSRFQLTLPAGWAASSVTFNHAKIDPTTSGTTYTWELRDLPFIEDEPSGPSVSNLAPRVAINYGPPASSQGPGARTFSNWADVSRWYSELSDPQVTLDDALAGKARELTINAKTELERIQIIGRYVQNLQYISVQIGMGRYRPHSATEVFAKSYGDCKDKANLMRAMLKAVKIEAYPVLIFSGDPTYVREDWASPSQFNHCIVAIRVSDETKAPTVIELASLGRIMIFDATDDNTPVGDLPSHEQGSFALIAAGDRGALLRMPSTPPESNKLERSAEVNLAADGSINATIRERSIGQSAVGERNMFRRLSRPEYTKLIENWITHGASGAKVSKVDPLDNKADGNFALDVEFTAGAYAQLMQDRLLVFKPAIVSRLDWLQLTGALRKNPVVLDSHAYTETVRVKLPEGFNVDEMPDPVKLETSFGNYASTYEVKDGHIIFTRTLTQRAATIPANQYSAVRTFFERIRAAEQSPVVLAR